LLFEVFDFEAALDFAVAAFFEVVDLLLAVAVFFEAVEADFLASFDCVVFLAAGFAEVDDLRV